MKTLDLKSLELPPELVAKGKKASATKPKKRRQHFVRVPWMWIEKLIGCRGQTLRVAFVVLYLDWKAKGRPVKLANTDGGRKSPCQVACTERPGEHRIDFGRKTGQKITDRPSTT